MKEILRLLIIILRAYLIILSPGGVVIEVGNKCPLVIDLLPWHSDPAKRRVKMLVPDVEQLLQDQNWFRQQTSETFKFALGFNSDWFLADPGQQGHNLGDLELLRQRQHFSWFDHLPGHQVVSGRSLEEIRGWMERSKNWASAQHLGPYIIPYGVTPNHLGMADKYLPLYQAWSSVWGTNTASAPLRGRGFEFYGIKVAPRFSCGAACRSDYSLFSQVSKNEIRQTVRDQMFKVMIGNDIAIFLSHQSGFAGDRIASFAFKDFVRFIREWTTVELRGDSVDKLVERYFTAGVDE
jgi:hypothetical protein